ncbi:choice-of-anchor M domain-containing protein [Corynebacterium hindlerae]|uniref:choice-of-anchor M domain-containing protein n=1 Tax=Corynebacterium hindlerae TaxID=699041 RepID=UPI003AAB5C6A
MKKTLSFVAASLLAFSTLVPTAQATEFKPGNRGFGVNLPADTKMAGTDELHPCAGRKLAYQAHFDAIYATHYNGELTTMIVDGQVPVPADELCMRLAPDANRKGDEVSRLVVPYDDPNLSFLGEPGDILWVAPQEVDFTDAWRPLWAGAGAFDKHHELEVPTDFEGNKVNMTLAEVEGPGDVELFFYNRSVQKPKRIFSTKDKMMNFDLQVGSHGHYSWTFSKPGIYDLTWQVSGKKTDGSTETGPKVTTRWLVGSDEEVGLPEGTTKNLAPIKRSAEVIRDELSKAADPTAPPTPGEAEREVYVQSKDQVQKLLWRSNPKKIITHGHQDMGLFGAGREAEAKMHSDVDGDHRSTQFVYAVPNRALHQLPSAIATQLGVCAAWVLPQQQDFELPWPGFSTEKFDYSSVTADGLRLGLDKVEGPGRMIATHDSLTSTTIALDSEDLSLRVHYPKKAHDHMGFFFTQPGAYRVVYSFEGELAKGGKLYTEIVAYYMVGDSALYDAAETMGIDPKTLNLSEQPERDTTPTCEQNSDKPGTGESGTDETDPSTDPTSAAPAPGSPTPPSEGGKSQGNGAAENIGLALGLGAVGLKLASHLMNPDKNSKDSTTAKTAPAAAAPAAKTGNSDNSPAPAKAQTGGSKAPASAGGGTGGGTKAPASGGGSKPAAKSDSKAKKNSAAPTKQTVAPKRAPSKKSTPVPAAPNQNSQNPQVTNSAQTGGLTSGGWLAGFVIGIGLMSLLGGLGLFLATARALRQLGVQSQQKDM